MALRPQFRFLPVTLVAAQLALGVLSTGCGGTSGDDDAGTDANTPSDLGRLPDGAVLLPDGNVVRPDAGLPDGAVLLPDGNVVRPDAGLPDGAVLLPDGNVVFPDGGGAGDMGSGMDAAMLPDLDVATPLELPETCFDESGAVNLCGCLTSTDCATVACTGDTVCVDDGCGGRRCVPAGHPCVDDSDCPSGATCEDSAAGRSCRTTSAECRSDRECPLGFACEAATCVDRRLPCDNTRYSCPVGYICDIGQQQVQSFCRRIDVPCGNSEVCPQPGACYDLDADGAKECVPAVLRCTPSLCEPDGRICGAQPEQRGYTCGFAGSCAVQQCPTLLACVDVAGDGRPTCLSPGTCTAHSDCGPRQLCAVPHLEASPRCVGATSGGPR